MKSKHLIGYEYAPSNNGAHRWRKEIYATNYMWVYPTKGKCRYDPFIGYDEQIIPMLESYEFEHSTVHICYDRDDTVIYLTTLHDIMQNGYKYNCYRDIRIGRSEWKLVQDELKYLKKLKITP